MTFANKEAIIPSICGAAVAAVSVLFYSVLLQTASTNLMAEFIAVTSLAAMVQIAFVPQSWVYVFGAYEPMDRAMRISASAVVELTGALCGLLIATFVAWMSPYGLAVLLAYLSLAMAGSTGVQGFFRGEGRWNLYVVFVTLPGIIRLTIVILAIFTGNSFDESLTQLVAVYLLIPESVRFLLLTVQLIRRAWQPVTWRQLQDTSHQLFRNWMYDIGSATTEVADKYILSLIISPVLLIVYFFVRKISTAVTIILEPFYSSKYRALVGTQASTRTKKDFSEVLVAGYLIAMLMCALTLIGIKVLGLVSIGRMVIVPEILLANLGIFAACLFIDGSISANRWGRYISILNGSVATLFVVRCICFVVFILTVMFLPVSSSSVALASGFLCYALLELAYVTSSTHHVKLISY